MCQALSLSWGRRPLHLNVPLCVTVAVVDCVCGVKHMPLRVNHLGRLSSSLADFCVEAL